MTKDEIVTALREHAEWAKANEWETPITLGDDLSDAADLIENQQREIETLRQANRALRERLEVHTMPKSDPNTCGSCKNFERIPETKRGTCKVHRCCKNRYGQIDERRGKFEPAQSRKSCKQYDPRGSGGSVKEGREWLNISTGK